MAQRTSHASAGARQYIRKNLPSTSKKLQKLIKYNSADDRIRAKLDLSRSTEWNKWKSFNAAVPIDAAQFQSLTNEGFAATPMQWVETDKNEHLRRENGAYVEEKLKSRLVNCGNFEDATGIRTDSPTCDVEGQRLLMSWCSSNEIRIKCADITNAYFQGHQFDRLIRMRPQRGCRRALFQRAVDSLHEYPSMGLVMLAEDCGYDFARHALMQVGHLRASCKDSSTCIKTGSS